jgi:hypothetical protein
MIGLKVVAASAAALLALAPMTGFAQNARGFYAATPTAAPTQESLITRGTAWKCDGGTCTAAKGTSRDTIMCELVAREVGTLIAFRAGATDFNAEALAKCNAKAR